MEKFGICLIQADLKDSIPETVENAVRLIREAVKQYKPKIVALSECFYSSYDPETFEYIAESIPDGFTSIALRNVAKELQVYVIGGIIERDANGSASILTLLLAHLCDIHTYDNQLDEVSYLKAGNDVTTFEIEGVKFGVAICYDANFHEFINLYGRLGCKVVFFPSAYDKIIGESKWKLVYPPRALENQIYVAAISSARNPNSSFVAYGHSMVINPYGRIIAEAGTDEEIVYSEIDLKELEKIRIELPLHKSRRPDIYKRKEFADL